jgi:BirA family biotin operon repressor/biotin-[acetyl-CoA-carboxylase] ligase
LGWRFEGGVSGLSSLPLVLALSASTALAGSGLPEHHIKWPNDLLLDGRKLGGCLAEVWGDAGGPCFAVLGIGLNVRMPVTTPGTADIDQPWTDVAAVLPDISRNRLAARLLGALVEDLERFAEGGFEPFRSRWAERDGLRGREVRVRLPGRTVCGVANGVSSRGGLLLATREGVQELYAGEASLAG